MTDRAKLYSGVSRAAWGYFFLYFDIKLGGLNILPHFAAYLLFLSAIRLLSEERRDLALLRPLGVLLACVYAVDWLCGFFGMTLSGQLPPLDLILSVAALYFHFQLLTDFAALATRYQGEGSDLERRLLQWRTVQAILMTALTLTTYLSDQFGHTWNYVIGAMVAVYLIAGLCLMAALFALRRLFRDGDEIKDA